MSILTVSVMFILLLPCQDVEELESDVLHMKNGQVINGRILSETESHYTIEMLIKGSKGQTGGTARLTVAKAEVNKIERMSEEARARAVARASGFRERRNRLADALERIRVQRTTIADKPALTTVGTHFEIVSTCDEDFLKEATFYLEEIFQGYLQYFDIKHNSDQRIRVYLLSNNQEYIDFQTQNFGHAVMNAAFYVSKANVIVAYNMIQKSEAQRVNKRIRSHNQEIEDLKRKLKRRERAIAKDYRQARKRIDGQADLIRNDIRRGNATNKAELLRELARKKRELHAKLRKEKKGIDERFKEFKRECNAEVEKNKKAIRRNRTVLSKQNTKMFEILFHEGFHAFVSNYLFESASSIEVPRWLNEGMAMYFEMSVVEAGELVHGGLHQDLLRLLKDRIQDDQIIPLRKVLLGGPNAFVITHEKDMDRSTLYYGESWALVHFLTRSVSREQLEGYVADVLAGSPKDVAFERLMGKSVEQVQADWIGYVNTL